MINTDPQHNDHDLIGRALAGDRLAGALLAERHRKLVLAIARRALGNADDAHDVAQEALMYAHQHLSDVRDRHGFAGWLRHVTLSLCADYRRRRGTRRLGEPITQLNEASEETDYAGRLAIRQAVAHLSDEHRAAFLLHYVGGWSQEEVAVMTGAPVATVRSRLMAGKRLLRIDLESLYPAASPKRKSMSQQTFALSKPQAALIAEAFPGARILSVQADPEPWMPFNPRIQVALKDGTERAFDIRSDLTLSQADLIAALEPLGIRGPRIIHQSADGVGALCEIPRGENLLLWALGGTPHRIRLATERAFEAIDRLQGVTQSLRETPAGAALPSRTLADELDTIRDERLWNADPWLAEQGASREEWLRDPWFRDALAKTEAAIADIHDPLVFTNYLHFFPNGFRIDPGSSAYDEPLGWPGDERYQENPLVDYVSPFGHFGDPLLGLAMVWVYDCYPFVHTGFVEQFLWRRGVSRRDFAPRLAIKSLQMVARHLPVERPTEGATFWNGLRGWADQAIGWM